MKSFVWALALVGLVVGVTNGACGPTKPPLTPDVVEGDTDGGADMPAPPGSSAPSAPSPVPVPVPPG